MKKFNILALAALALSCVGSVSASQSSGWTNPLVTTNPTSPVLVSLAGINNSTPAEFLKGMKILSKSPSSSTIASMVAGSGKPITAVGAVDAKTSAKKEMIKNREDHNTYSLLTR